MSEIIQPNDELKKLVEAWDDLDERCPDCGGMESFCEEAGCESSSWTDADTRKYKDKCRLICKGVRDARNRNR